MAGFCAVTSRFGPDWREVAAKLKSHFLQQGFRQCRSVEAAGYSLHLFGDFDQENRVAPYYRDERNAGRFLASAGTLLAGNAAGVAALKRIAADRAANDLWGNYALVEGTDNELWIEIDSLGLYKMYSAADNSIASSSFLALAHALPACSPDTQSVYEYVVQGGTYGLKTPIQEISELDVGTRRNLVDDAVLPIPEAASRVPAPSDPADAVAELVRYLRSRFRQVGEAFSGNVGTALSGGYDSRLMLALLLDSGIEPHIHVYGSATSADVQIAKRVTESLGLPLDHVDKGKAYASKGLAGVPDNFLALDGLAPDGIFDNGADVASRLDRASSGGLSLNGGGGEIYRNFFYLPDRRYSSRAIVDVFYHQFDPGAFTRRFDYRRYVETLAEKISRCFDDGRSRLSRADVEWIFPAFRCRFWMGRNNSLNNRFGPALTPLVDRYSARLTSQLPVKWKNHGLLEAAMIRSVSPQLAALPSEHGYAFDRPPPWKHRTADWLTRCRPAAIRKRSFWLKQRLRSAEPAAAALAEIHAEYPDTVERMREFVHFGHIRDTGQIRRAASLGFLFQDLGC